MMQKYCTCQNAAIAGMGYIAYHVYGIRMFFVLVVDIVSFTAQSYEWHLAVFLP